MPNRGLYVPKRLRYALGLPFYDPEVGPPAWFKCPYEQPGLSKTFSAPWPRSEWVNFGGRSSTAPGVCTYTRLQLSQGWGCFEAGGGVQLERGLAGKRASGGWYNSVRDTSLTWSVGRASEGGYT
jgi:hypothetical protein